LSRTFYGALRLRTIAADPAVGAGGAVLVIAADIAVRLIAPDGQLLLGVVTAMLGAPFFLWLILRLRSES
jgi:iron complex transport system permease protein